jgi:O-antigen/teichoic acid export membrane protein
VAIQIALRGFGLLLGGAVAASLARGLDRTQFAWISIALATSGFVVLAGDLGMTQTAAADIAADFRSAPSVISSLIVFEAITAIPLTGLAMAVAMWAPPGETRLAACVICLVPLLTPLTCLSAVFTGVMRPARAVAALMAQNVLWTVAAVVGAATSQSVVWFAIGFLLAGVTQGLVTVWLAAKIAQPAWKGSIKGSWRLARRSWGVGAGAILWAAFTRGPLLLTQRIAGAAETARLAAAWRFIDGAYLLPSPMASVVLAVIAERKQAGGDLRRPLEVTLAVMASGAAALAVGLSVLGGTLGRVLMGEAYDDIGPVLIVSSIGVFAFCLDCVFGSVLIAVGRGGALARSAAWGVLAGAGTVLTIPSLGAVGAAAAVATAQLVRTTLLAREVRPIAGLGRWQTWLTAPIAVVAIGLGLALSSSVNSAAAGLAALSVFSAAALATRAVGPDDVRALLRRDVQVA